MAGVDPPADDDVPVIPAPPAEESASATVPVADPTDAEPQVPDIEIDPEASRRRVWPFLAGGGVLLIILVAVVTTIVVGAVMNAAGPADPGDTVIRFDKSFADVECDEFKATTTGDFQLGYFVGGFDCAQWKQIAEGLHDGGVYDYTVVVTNTAVNGKSADVTTNEQDTTPGDEQSYDLDYHLVLVDGHWLIDGIRNLG